MECTLHDWNKHDRKHRYTHYFILHVCIHVSFNMTTGNTTCLWCYIRDSCRDKITEKETWPTVPIWNADARIDGTKLQSMSSRWGVGIINFRVFVAPMYLNSSKLILMPPPLKKRAYCFATVGRSVGRSVGL